MKKPSVLIIFLTVFIDLIGFGIVVPQVPMYSRHYGASGLMIGAIVASFSVMQFLFAPVWGRLSDRIGRRPVLLLSTAGAAASYALFGIASRITDHTTALWLVVASRAFAGLCGGNIVVAQAYIADITPPEDRSRRMGLIGMAFGLGFIVGPILGGLTLRYLGPMGPGLVASGFCAANFILALFVLVESLQPGSEHVPARPHLDQWLHVLRTPKVGLLVIVFFLATFCFSCFETTLPLLVIQNFHLDIHGDERSASTVVYLFAFCATIGALVQGGAIGRLVKKHGEPKLIALSLLLTGASLAPMPLLSGKDDLSLGILFQAAGLPWLGMLALLAVLSVGSSLTRPPLFGLLSNLTPANEQGATIGVAQGAASLARILGPLFAAPLLDKAPILPYAICGALAVLTGLFVFRQLRTAPAATGLTV